MQVKYPYGLKDSGSADQETQAHLFSSNLIVALGDQDTNPNDNSLLHTPEADAQGLHRYDRGNYYFSESERICKANSTLFSWKKVIVKGVAQDFKGMMAETIDYLF